MVLRTTHTATHCNTTYTHLPRDAVMETDDPHLYIHSYIYTYTYRFTCTYMHMYAYIHSSPATLLWKKTALICVYIYMYTNIYTCIYIHMYVCIHTRPATLLWIKTLLVCVHAYIHTYVYLHAYILYINMGICIYIHLPGDAAMKEDDAHQSS